MSDYNNGYDEGYRAGMQKMREVGQARIEELEVELECWRDDPAAGWDKAKESRVKMARAVDFIQNFALRATTEEHDEDERDLIDLDSLRFERDCDIAQAYTTFAELKGETE